VTGADTCLVFKFLSATPVDLSAFDTSAVGQFLPLSTLSYVGRPVETVPRAARRETRGKPVWAAEGLQEFCRWLQQLK
jgi:hypothetical protein